MVYQAKKSDSAAAETPDAQPTAETPQPEPVPLTDAPEAQTKAKKAPKQKKQKSEEPKPVTEAAGPVDSAQVEQLIAQRVE